MAGGVWTAQNKVRPGAYINFESNNQLDAAIGLRGIVTMGMDLDWGMEDKLIDVTINDLVDGGSLAKVGFMVDNDKAKLPNLALQNAATLRIYRFNKGGTQATKSLLSGALTATAKYNGTFGNKIAIKISASTATTGKFNVQTYADGYLVDNQTIATLDELKNNSFVTFEGTGTPSAMESTLLEGGTNGEVSEANGYASYFDLLRISKWDTLAVPTTTATVLTSTIAFIEEMRENEGKYVQAVIPNHATVDYEGIINNINGVVLDEELTISAAEFCAWVAGATAGADVSESLTGTVVPNATSIVGMKTSAEIVDGILKGEFLLSLNQNGDVKVEKDINSLHTFTDKTYIFSKNRVMRELDEIGSGIEDIWETTYLGKVSNNDNGRTLFKSSIIDYLTDLQNRGGIDAFDRNSVVVEAGQDIDSVIASISVKPLDSMEFLYMTVNINE